MNLKSYTFISICLIAALLSGCASDKKEYQSDAQQEYEAAKHLVNSANYGQAAVDLEHFGSKYPYSKLASQGELLRIFASYKDGQYILSEVLSQRFMDQHPTHKSVDYAKYMLAMSQYKQRSSAEKDPTQNIAAIKSFKILIHDHPNSSYAKQGRGRLQSLYNSLAQHELTIGKYYFDQARFVAASNRFQQIVEHYQTTPSIEEALFYLVASYNNMNMKTDAKQIALLLKHNYPKSPWSIKAQELN
ncbi:MAG: outer membrane protein assembly factor BamD [Mariprofundus sp.]|nr:outer membrane protein assembly factor BamD [Mariprofundus sp.]